jgi:SPP1 family predicted phage head-tail adaptor
MLEAGSLDQRVRIEQKSVTRDSFKAEVVTWVTVATVWAEVTPLRGRELFAAAQLQSTADMRFRIRYRSDITTAHRLVHRGINYDVRYVAEIPPQKSGLEILAETGVHDGR